MGFRQWSIRLLLAFVGVAGVHSTGQASIVWNESSNGDLSNVQGTPTTVTLGVGVNSVLGTVGGGDTQDWITLHIPAGMTLNQIVNVTFTSTDLQGFTGFASGSAFSGSLNTPGNYNGYTHFGTSARNGSQPAINTVGMDIFPLMADTVNVAQGAKGFTIPLGAGDYSFLIQQLGASTTYQFDYITVAAVPEPSSLCLLGAIGAATLVRRAAQRRKGAVVAD